MSLKDAFSGVSPNKNSNKTHPRCLVGQAIESHEEGNVIAEKLADPSWSAPVIAKVLASEGIVISVTSIRVHRREECRCYGIGS